MWKVALTTLQVTVSFATITTDCANLSRARIVQHSKDAIQPHAIASFANVHGATAAINCLHGTVRSSQSQFALRHSYSMCLDPVSARLSNFPPSMPHTFSLIGSSCMAPSCALPISPFLRPPVGASGSAATRALLFRYSSRQQPHLPTPFLTRSASSSSQTKLPGALSWAAPTRSASFRRTW